MASYEKIMTSTNLQMNPLNSSHEKTSCLTAFFCCYANRTTQRLDSITSNRQQKFLQKQTKKKEQHRQILAIMNIAGLFGSGRNMFDVGNLADFGITNEDLGGERENEAFEENFEHPKEELAKNDQPLLMSSKDEKILSILQLTTNTHQISLNNPKFQARIQHNLEFSTSELERRFRPNIRFDVARDFEFLTTPVVLNDHEINLKKFSTCEIHHNYSFWNKFPPEDEQKTEKMNQLEEKPRELDKNLEENTFSQRRLFSYPLDEINWENQIIWDAGNSFKQKTSNPIETETGAGVIENIRSAEPYDFDQKLKIQNAKRKKNVSLKSNMSQLNHFFENQVENNYSIDLNANASSFETEDENLIVRFGALMRKAPISNLENSVPTEKNELFQENKQEIEQEEEFVASNNFQALNEAPTNSEMKNDAQIEANVAVNQTEEKTSGHIDQFFTNENDVKSKKKRRDPKSRIRSKKNGENEDGKELDGENSISEDPQADIDESSTKKPTKRSRKKNNKTEEDGNKNEGNTVILDDNNTEIENAAVISEISSDKPSILGFNEKFKIWVEEPSKIFQEDLKNMSIDNFDWKESIVFDPIQVLTMSKPSLIYDLNDRNQNFKFLRIENSNLEKQNEEMEKKKKDASQLNELLQYNTELQKKPKKDGFDVSNDTFYDENKVSEQGKLITKHADPAIKLNPRFYKNHLSDERLLNLHQQPHDFESNPKWKQTKIYYRTPKNVKKRAAKTLKSLKALSATNHRLIQLEFIERNPPILLQFGMGAKIVNYFIPISNNEDNNQSQAMDFTPPIVIDGDLQIVRSKNDIPLIVSNPQIIENSFKPADQWIPNGSNIGRNCSSGELYITIQNSLFCAQIFPIAAQINDFILVATGSSIKGIRYFIREAPTRFIVGHTQLKTPVHPPRSRETESLSHSRLVRFCFQFFAKQKQDRNGKLSIRLDDLKKVFPLLPDTTLRKFLKSIANFDKTECNGGAWFLKDDAEIPDENALQNILTPEMICQDEAMRMSQVILERKIGKEPEKALMAAPIMKIEINALPRIDEKCVNQLKPTRCHEEKPKATKSRKSKSNSSTHNEGKVTKIKQSLILKTFSEHCKWLDNLQVKKSSKFLEAIQFVETQMLKTTWNMSSNFIHAAEGINDTNPMILSIAIENFSQSEIDKKAIWLKEQISKAIAEEFTGSKDPYPKMTPEIAKKILVEQFKVQASKINRLKKENRVIEAKRLLSGNKQDRKTLKELHRKAFVSELLEEFFERETVKLSNSLNYYADAGIVDGKALSKLLEQRKAEKEQKDEEMEQQEQDQEEAEFNGVNSVFFGQEQDATPEIRSGNNGEDLEISNSSGSNLLVDDDSVQKPTQEPQIIKKKVKKTRLIVKRITKSLENPENPPKIDVVRDPILVELYKRSKICPKNQKDPETIIEEVRKLKKDMAKVVLKLKKKERRKVLDDCRRWTDQIQNEKEAGVPKKRRSALYVEKKESNHVVAAKEKKVVSRKRKEKEMASTSTAVDIEAVNRTETVNIGDVEEVKAKSKKRKVDFVSPVQLEKNQN